MALFIETKLEKDESLNKATEQKNKLKKNESLNKTT
jgi:hypothetical protein